MYIDWKDAPEWAQWLAIDADDVAYWHQTKPYKSDFGWSSAGEVEQAPVHSKGRLFAGDWRIAIWPRGPKELPAPAAPLTDFPFASAAPCQHEFVTVATDGGLVSKCQHCGLIPVYEPSTDVPPVPLQGAQERLIASLRQQLAERDALILTLRRKLGLANIELMRVEIARLEQELKEIGE